MSQTIILKKSAVAGKVPQAADLEVGEVAINMADRILYFKDSSGAVVAVKGEAAEELTQAQVESSASTDFGLVSGRRIWQALAKWWEGIGTVFGKTLLGSANASAARNQLGLGTAATRDVGTSSGQVLINDPWSLNGAITGKRLENNAVVGYCIITLPYSGSSEKMFSFTVKTYSSYNTQSYEISGYLYNYLNNWHLPTVLQTASSIMENRPLYFGVEDGYAYISVPVESYAGVGIFNNVMGFNSDLSFKGTTFEFSTTPKTINSVSYTHNYTLSSATMAESTGQSTQYPMTQKAVTDAIAARGFEDASGVLTAQSGDLSNAISNFLQATTQADAKSRLGVPNITVSTSNPSGGADGDVWYKV